MNSFLQEALKSYWAAPEIAINLIIFLNLLGALGLGLIVGYERSYIRLFHIQLNCQGKKTVKT